MLSQDTAGKIWQCHREIAAGTKLLADVAKLESENKRRDSGQIPAKLSDMFGRERDLQLGVPSGDSSHRLFGVAPDLAVSIIKSHIANQQSELARLNEIVKLEIST